MSMCVCVGVHVCMQEESDGARVGLSPGGESSKYFSAPQAFLSRLCAEDDLSACRTRGRLGPHGLSGPAAHGHLIDRQPILRGLLDKKLQQI